MEHIAILSSVPFESDLLLAELRPVKMIRIGKRDAHRGKIFGKNVIILNTGIGKVNAAASAAALLENFKISFVINCGIGGAYPKAGLNIGDVAAATKEIYGDEGIVTSKGIEGYEKIGIPILQTGKRKYFNELPVDRGLSNKACSMASQVKRGSFVTVSAASATYERAVEFGKKYHAVCENMEGAAVAHVCTLYKTPFLELRGLSNTAGIRDKRRWKIKPASENCQKAVLEMIRSL